MIKSSILSIPVAAAILVAGCNSGNSDSPTENPTSTQAVEASPATNVAENCLKVGEYFAVSAGLNQLEFSEAEINGLVEGFKNGLSSDLTMQELQADISVVRDFLQGKHAAKSAKDKEVNQKAAEAYVAELKNNPDVTFTESGLGYEIKTPGSEEKASTADSVSVNYRGTLIDGTEFDAAMDESKPVTFPLGGVIPGFSEGLQLVGKGGEIRLYIPSNLGYGDNPRPGSPIKAGAMLVFDVTIRDIQKPKPQVPQKIDLPTPPPPPSEEE